MAFRVAITQSGLMSVPLGQVVRDFFLVFFSLLGLLNWFIFTYKLSPFLFLLFSPLFPCTCNGYDMLSFIWTITQKSQVANLGSCCVVPWEPGAIRVPAGTLTTEARTQLQMPAVVMLLFALVLRRFQTQHKNGSCPECSETLARVRREYQKACKPVYLSKCNYFTVVPTRLK